MVATRTSPTIREPSSEVIAAIDIGTNSVHMVIARAAANGRFEVLTRQKEMVRLGSGRGEMKELEPDAVDRGVAALARCRSLAESFEAEITAVATSAVREARNRDVFLDRARREAGVVVDVINGAEEARLIYLGVLQALPVFDQPLLLVDVGGGSTEVLFGRGGDVPFARSLKLGSLRMTRRFFPDGVVEGDALDRSRRYVADRLAQVAHDAAGQVHEIAVASSGTAEAVAAMALAASDDAAPQSMNGTVVSRRQVTEVVEALAAAATTDERRRLPGMDPARADILLGGAVVLEQVCRALKVKSLTVSEFALREGVLLDAMETRWGGTLDRTADLRRASIFHVMGLCDDDPDHSMQVARLSLGLFDALRTRLGLAPSVRELLEAAALLANVGLVVAHSGHHKHSYYVIRNSEHLMGFTDREVEMIAQIARYHRKSPPSEDKHAEFAALDEPDRATVRAAAALLRVAIGLDRNHDGAVDRVEVDEGADGRTTVRAVAATHDGGPSDLSLECWSANERVRLLAEVLGADVEVVAG